MANLTAVPKWIKLIIAILLLPVCGGAAMALWQVLQRCGSADTTWVPFLGGAACWMVIFLLLPKPMWIYVLGHELTHALWTWLFGGEVKKMKITVLRRPRGHFQNQFPDRARAVFFSAVRRAGHRRCSPLGNLIWNWHGYLVWFHLCVGAAYAFHVTLTFHVLQTRQTDITARAVCFPPW